jgi:hypothetical protein
MILNIDKTRVITFTRKTNPLNYNYKLSGTNTMCTDCIKDLGKLLDSKLLFHHVNYLFCFACIISDHVLPFLPPC